VDENLAEHLRETERARLRALVTVDIEAAQPLHAEDYQLITPGGTALTKSEYLDAISTGGLRYEAFEPVSQIAVRGGPEAAIVRYRVHIRVTEAAEAAADITCWHTDYYERRGQRWQAVWSQATRIAVLG